VKRTDRAFIDDILIAADSIRGYVRGVAKDDFLSKRDAMVQDAVIRQVGIVGEAASKLSPVFRAKHPTIPWTQIIGIRNVVVHQYWEVDLEMVWGAATRDVPTHVKKLNATMPGGGVVDEWTSRTSRRPLRS
jgi:uncharacterized protein with HEPN domain